MFKVQIVYTSKLPTTKQVDELKQLLPFLDITFIKYDGVLKSYGTTQLDFKWLKTLSGDCDIKCFLTTIQKLEQYGIKSHIGLYNLESDHTHDFYISLPRRLDARARANGFKSNFAWIFCHEYLHGTVWETTKDVKKADGDVHQWEKDGVLKVKLAEHVATYQGLVATNQSLLEKLQAIFKSLTQAPKLTSKPDRIQPLVERHAVSIIADMERLGHAVRLVQGYRSIEEQNKLYAQGRTTAGNIVTNAKGGESFHNYGVAVDFVFRKSGYNATDAQWELLGKTGEKYGFSWGGRWKGFIDKPHFEMTLGYSLKDFQTGKVDYSKFN